MKNILRIIIAAISIAGMMAAGAASATEKSYYGTRTVMLGEWAEYHWNYFNGCEDDNNTACFGSEAPDPQCIVRCGNTFFQLGEPGVKQGVYQLAGNTPEYAHGKLILKYAYKLNTAEPSNSTADTAIVKLKDTETNEILYMKTLSAADATDEWVGVTKRFSAKLLNRPLQLVFEVENNNSDLTVFSVDGVSMIGKSGARVHGEVNYKELGKSFAAEGATVELMNKKGKKIISTTTVDANGDYSFFPVKNKKKYTIRVTSGDLSGEVKTKTIKRGTEYRENFTLK